jgi:5'-methylthioadenosine phosphorylase
VAHVSLAHPISAELAGVCYAAAQTRGRHHPRGGTYLNMEGPQFSTRAESLVYRQWGVDVIGMTNLQEAKLAREAEIATRRSPWSPTTTAGTRGRRRSPARA